MPSVTTLNKEASATLIEKKSEFIAYASPIKSEEQALEFIKRIKKKHADARHNVYAYILGNGSTARYSDDGEPQGTAGIPVLDILRKNGVTDAVIVVTRYFGGILLGAGGLVRAYSSSAKMALDEAGIVTFDTFACFELKLSYNDYGKITTALSAALPLQDSIDFASDVVMKLALPEGEYEEFKAEITEITAGRAEFTELGSRYDKR